VDDDQLVDHETLARFVLLEPLFPLCLGRSAVVGSTFFALSPQEAFDTLNRGDGLPLVWFQFTFATCTFYHALRRTPWHTAKNGSESDSEVRTLLCRAVPPHCCGPLHNRGVSLTLCSCALCGDVAFSSARAFAFGHGHFPFLTSGFIASHSAVCATIVLGAVSERATLVSSIVSIVVVGGLAFPIVSHWVWSDYGWLGYSKLSGRLFGSGAFDLAGSGVVHITGGTAALLGATLVGPRIGRYDEATRHSFDAHNITLVCQGTFVLWAGFTVFNSASVLTITDNYVAAGRCLINTLLAGSTGGITMLIVSRLSSAHSSVLNCLNGVLAGLVGICSSCSIVLPYSALITGVVCSLAFFVCEKAMARCKIDDPVAAAPLHLGAGISGMLLTGFTAYPPFLRDAFPGRESYPGGIFYDGDSSGALLGAQVVAILSIIAVVAVLLTPVLFGLKLCGVLVYTEEQQLMGADEAEHGAAAYNFNAEETSADLLTTWQASTPHLSPRANLGAVAAVVDAADTVEASTKAVAARSNDGRIDVTSSFTSAKLSPDTVGTGATVEGQRFASFVVTTDSGHRSASRRLHCGSMSATASPSSHNPFVIDVADLDEEVETVVPMSSNMHSTF